MAALPAGVQYGLSSESSYKENKELMFVKLTDSALKAIEDFIRNNRDKLAKPKIQFLPGNEGKISIPAGGNGQTGEATFHFSINSNAEMEGPQGSFECVRSGGAKRLESCGPLPRRMRVLANDDSYEATKDRMARTVAAEQSKCTRVIKPNQTDIGRRVKVRHSLYTSSAPAPAPHLAERPERPHVSDKPERPHLPDRPHLPERAERSHLPDRAERSHLPDRAERPHLPERAERPFLPDRAERPHLPDRAERPHLPDRAERSHLPDRAERPQLPDRAERPQLPDRAERPHLPDRPERPPMTERPERTERTERGDKGQNVTRAPPPPAAQRPLPTNPDLSRRSIKERLIQLLALKPFKKPELYARLSSEGIKDKDRALVNKVLPQIGALKDNCYHLRRCIWNDVIEDWPFYTEEEKRILKRRKPQNLTPPLSSDSTNSVSPRASPSTKRVGSIAGEEPPAAKKLRISHYRGKEARPGSPSSGYATAGSGASSGERHASDTEDDRTANVKKDNGYTLSYNTIKDLYPSLPVAKTNGFKNSPPVEQTSITEKDITNNEPLENIEIASVPDDIPTDMEEIERKYPPITSSSMRRQYKNEFTSLYQEYLNAYDRLARVANLFSTLEQKLKRVPPHSPDAQGIEQRIMDEYRRIRRDVVYQQDKRRVDFLHRKLTHIKRCVHEYDQIRGLKPERVQAASTTQAY